MTDLIQREVDYAEMTPEQQRMVVRPLRWRLHQ